MPVPPWTGLRYSCQLAKRFEGKRSRNPFCHSTKWCITMRKYSRRRFARLINLVVPEDAAELCARQGIVHSNCEKGRRSYFSFSCNTHNTVSLKRETKEGKKGKLCWNDLVTINPRTTFTGISASFAVSRRQKEDEICLYGKSVGLLCEFLRSQICYVLLPRRTARQKERNEPRRDYACKRAKTANAMSSIDDQRPRY